MARNWDAFPDHKRKEIKKVKLAVAVPTRLALKLLSRVRPHILSANCANVKSFTLFFFKAVFLNLNCALSDDKTLLTMRRLFCSNRIS